MAGPEMGRSRTVSVSGDGGHGGEWSEPVIRIGGVALSRNRWHPKSEWAHEGRELSEAEPGARGYFLKELRRSGGDAGKGPLRDQSNADL